mmetsp:Transcript_14955/g.23577  ORF Transcript_14955/g.23577 Transcript_14955/m.23577 type:complete len:230 (-) Transcript_14955:335-1024(-)
MMDENLVQSSRQIWGCQPVQQVLVDGVRLEEALLAAEALADVDAVVDVLLPPVDHAHVPPPQRDHPVVEHLGGVGARVHEVDLGQHPDGPVAHAVHLLGELESVRVGQVPVGRGDGQDDRARVADVGQAHLPDLVLDVQRLVPHRHLGDPGEVHEGEVEHAGAEHAQVDALVRDALVAPREPVRLAYDLIPDFIEVGELTPGHVQELPPLLPIGPRWICLVSKWVGGGG